MAETNFADINIEAVNNRSLEIMADIMDPYFELMKDKQFTQLYMSNVKEAVKYACRNHPKETIEIAAILSGKSVDEFVVNPFTLPIILLSAIGTYAKINNDLFPSQVQNKEEASSGSATENTEASDQSGNS